MTLTSTTHDESPFGKNRTAPLQDEKQYQGSDNNGKASDIAVFFSLIDDESNIIYSIYLG